MGTHVVLLREPQSNAAKVFLFGESGSNQKMKLWRFFADDDTLRLPPATFVDSLSVLESVAHPDTAVNDLFCNGHSVLPDGRMLFLGGNYQPRNACETVYTFDPAWFGGAANPWTTDATMAAERWYATATALPDGRTLAAAGEARSWFGAYGGRTNAGASDRTWRSLAFAARYYWGDTTAVPAEITPPTGLTRVRKNFPTAGQYPRAREDHAQAGIPSGTAVIFGGRQVVSAAEDTVLGDAWLVQPSPLPNDSVMTWIRLNQMDYDATPGLPEAIPCPRTRAAMVWAGVTWGDARTTLTGAQDSLACYLFGGLDSSGHALSDLWLGRVRPSASRLVDGYYRQVQDLAWQRVLPDDTPGRARYGHTLWFDPGDAGVSGAPYARLVVFGGQTNDSTLAPDSLYTFGVGSVAPAQWQALRPATDPVWGSPKARQGHMATQQRPMLRGESHKFYLFGGQDGRGNLLTDADARCTNGLDSHLWALSRSDTTAAGPNYEWDWIAWSCNQKPGPLPRARAAMAYDSWSERLVVVGGDLNGDGQAGGLTDSVWCIQVESYGSGVKNKWFQPPVRARGFPAMPPTKGLSLLAYGDAGYINESSLEAYDPSGTSPSCSPWSAPQGTWTTVTSQDSLSQRSISAYPYLFVLPDGRLFNAGPAPADRLDQPYRRFYSLATNQWSDDASHHFMDAAVMGSAVMYRPGKVLRAGSHGPSDQGTAHARTETIEIAAGQMPAWEVYGGQGNAPLTARMNHNLTLLPTGDVLATGGVTKPLSDGGLPVQRPQLWRVGAGSWNAIGDSLREDHKIRNYHSAALLLPDGRVMTSGGEDPNLADRVTVSIFEPPYLFSGDSYAHRPAIADGPEVLRYGEPFTLTLADAADLDSIRSVALLRPAAVTHGFDQSQRFVPLAFVARTAPARLLAWAPPDSFYAPPGEYMLFVTLGRGTGASSLPVPSLARWVTVRRPAGAQRDSLDVVPPRGGTYMNLSKVNACESTPAIRLRWNAPADDDTLAFSGKARSYNLRWTLNSSPPHFNQWTAKATAAPQAVFATEEVMVDGLQDQVWYRFALKAIGDNADSSALSNELVTNAVQCDDGGSSGGGGGGQYGTRAQTASRGDFGKPGAGSPSANENTLFPGVPLGARARDMLRLRQPPGLVGGQRRAYLRQGESRGLLVSQVRLLAADHAEGTEVVVAPSGELRAGVRAATTLARDRMGRDVTARATGLGAEPVYADSGEVLEISLPGQVSPAARTLVLELMAGGSQSAGVLVERDPGDGVWTQLAVVHPRRDWDVTALPEVRTERLRLTFKGAHALRFAGELAGASAVVARPAPLVHAVSTFAGEAFDAVGGTVDTTLAMVAGDTLSLLFGDLAPPQEGARTWLLEATGTPVAPSLAHLLAGRLAKDEPSGLPTAFAVHPAAPNPAHGTVRLAFDLPRRTSVRLEIFDPQGRRVRRFDGEYAAGRQALEWDLRHTNGPRLAPGIYSFRVVAGTFRAQRKLVVLP